MKGLPLGPSLAALSIVLLAAQATVYPVPYQPRGKWTVDYQQDKCILSHDFAANGETLTLAITPAPVGDESEIALITPGTGKRGYVKQPARISIDARSVAVGFNTFVTTRKLRVTRINLTQTDVDAMGQAATIRLPVTQDQSVVLVPKGFGAALKASTACRADLRRSWGLDEASVAKVVTPAKALGMHDWITYSDYPPDALRADAEGTVSILWVIGTDGRVTNCHTLKSSGVKVLDEAACAALTLRGRYTPAKDSAGKPIISWSSRTVRWLLPIG